MALRSRFFNPFPAGSIFKIAEKIFSLIKSKGAKVKYFRFHALRHLGASLLDGANVPIGSIQRILGHENRSTTKIYLHSLGDPERQAMDILNAQFDNFSHTNSHTALMVIIT